MNMTVRNTKQINFFATTLKLKLGYFLKLISCFNLCLYNRSLEN